MTAPQLVPGLHVTVNATSAVIDGGARRFVLRDEVSVALLTRHELFDGRRSIEQIAISAGVDRHAAAVWVEAMHMRSVLDMVDADADADAEARVGPIDHGYVRRSRTRADAARVAAARAAASIIVHEGTLAGALAPALRTAGVGSVTVLGRANRAADAGAQYPTAAIEVCVNAAPRTTAGVVVPITVAGEVCEFGPAVGTRARRCLSCCVPAWLANPDGPTSPATVLCAAGLVTAHVLAMIDGDATDVWTHRISLDLSWGATESIPFGTAPDCPACGAESSVDATSWAYEQQTETNALDRRPIPTEGGGVVVGTPAKHYLDLPYRPLAGLNDPRDAIIVDLLAGALGGQAGRPARRGSPVAPSVTRQGDLHAFTLPGSTAFTKAGAYWDIRAGRLIAVQRTGAAAPDMTSPPAIRVALVGDIEGTALRYGAAAYRLLLHDAGVSANRLRARAAELGLRSRLSEAVEYPHLRRDLNLPDRDEPLCIVELTDAGAAGHGPNGVAGEAAGIQSYDLSPVAVEQGLLDRLASTIEDADLTLVAVSANAGARTLSGAGAADTATADTLATDDQIQLRTAQFLQARGIVAGTVLYVAADLGAGPSQRYGHTVVRAAMAAAALADHAVGVGLGAGLLARPPATVLTESRYGMRRTSLRALAGVVLGLRPARTTSPRSRRREIQW